MVDRVYLNWGISLEELQRSVAEAKQRFDAHVADSNIVFFDDRQAKVVTAVLADPRSAALLEKQEKQPPERNEPELERRVTRVEALERELERRSSHAEELEQELERRATRIEELERQVAQMATRASGSMGWTPERRAEQSAKERARWTPELRAEHSARMRALWTPERRAEHSARSRAGWTPEKRAAHSDRMASRRVSAETRERMSRAARRRWGRADAGGADVG